MAENKNPSSRSNQEQGIDKDTRTQKEVEGHPISVGVNAGSEAYGKTPIEKGVIRRGNKFYRPPLPSTYKETEIS